MLLEEYMAAIEESLNSYLPPPDPASPFQKVEEAMRYSLLSGGKRIRPILTLSFCGLCCGEWERALPFACAVEMVHTYSLIHDDLPCMDDDDLRRGHPTCHKVYGQAIALLAGDGLLTKAFEAALSFPQPGRAQAAALELSRLAGHKGMVGGQCVDLLCEGQQVDLELLGVMNRGKTVALIDAACRMGVIAGGGRSAALRAASEYALGVGMAFQLRDDILDLLGDPQKMGKNTGMDATRNKRNYVSLLGPEKTQELVVSYTAKALESLSTFKGDAGFLKDLALSLAGRCS